MISHGGFGDMRDRLTSSPQVPSLSTQRLNNMSMNSEQRGRTNPLGNDGGSDSEDNVSICRP